MTGTDTLRTPPRRRASGIALVTVGALLVAALAGITVALVRARGSAATAEVALQLTRQKDAAAVVVESVVLTGRDGGTLRVSATGAPAAPAEADLGVILVPVGQYSGVTATVAGEVLHADAGVALHDGELRPLLLVVSAHHLEADWGNQAVNQGLQAAAGLLPRLADVTFHDQAGRTVTTASLRGRIVVLAALDTGCSDTCPLYTAVFQDLQRVLRDRALAGRVVIVDVSMDPQRDTAAELAAYASRFGADWELLAADPQATKTFWSALHASYVQLAATPGTVDWYTGKPALYHLHHDSLALVVDEQGYVRADLQGIPRLGHGLSAELAGQLAVGSSQPDQEKLAAWTITDLLDRIDTVLGLPAEADRGVERAARIGAHAPDFTLPALDGTTVALHQEVGHPTVVNFFASWCEPCRQELPLLNRAASSHPELGVLLLDQGESTGQAKGFVHDLLGGGAAPGVTALLDGDKAVGGDYQAIGLPVTVFVDSDGVVRAEQVGQLDDASLQHGLAAIGVV